MKKIALKNNVFPVVKCTDDNFSEIKRFCGDNVLISYETCPIDDYWSIKICDDTSDKWTVVPSGSYIMKLPDGKFTVIDRYEMDDNYIELDNDNSQVVDSKENLIKKFEVIYMFYANTDPKDLNHMSFRDYALKNWDNVNINELNNIG